MSSPKHIIRSTVQCTIALGLVAFMISTALPWLARSGFAGDVIEYSYTHERDATPLFYSESDRTWEIMNEVDTLKKD